MTNDTHPWRWPPLHPSNLERFLAEQQLETNRQIAAMFGIPADLWTVHYPDGRVVEPGTYGRITPRHEATHPHVVPYSATGRHFALQDMRPAYDHHRGDDSGGCALLPDVLHDNPWVEATDPGAAGLGDAPV